MILAGDIGGTKTNLALFDEQESGYAYAHLATYRSQSYSSLEAIVKEFLESCKSMYDPLLLQRACFAIAGPIVEGVCRATNLPWIIDSKELSTTLQISNIHLLNDLEANAWAIEILSKDAIFELFPGKNLVGNRAVISPGTGLGEAGLFWDGIQYHPMASEGGHCEFGPRNELQISLCRYLYKKFGHASYERILSGPGLYNVYQFFKEGLGHVEPDWLATEIRQNDPAKVITTHALSHKSELCVESLDLFASILGSETANCVLKDMAKGGVYLGGGIPPKILPKLREPLFFEGYADKGRFRDLLETIPIRVILDDKASLKGAAHYCRLQQEK